METYGIITFNKGFNLKDEVSNRLAKAGLPIKSIRHYVNSPYQFKRYKPEFVGQEVWINTYRHSKAICFTQTDYDYILQQSGEIGLYDYLYSIIA